MIKDALSHFHLPFLTCIALLIFFTFFAGMLVWIFRRGSGNFYQRIEQLPLNEEGLS
ncbi:MAG: cbb3-type cytochrome c oxidase subunit 3 [bacterium]